MVADDPRFPAPNPPQKWLDQQKAIRDENRERNTAELRDAFALAIAPSVVEALSPKGYGQKDWTPAKVIGGTIYAIADAIIVARSKVTQ